MKWPVTQGYWEKRQLRVLVCGGREFDAAAFIYAELGRLHEQYLFNTVIEGDARGVDRIAGEWVRGRGFELIVFSADWKNEGRHAALIRNHWMLQEGKPDLAVAFPGDNGTWYTCSHAEKLGIPILRCTPGHCRPSILSAGID